MTSRTGLYTAFAGTAVGAISTLASVLLAQSTAGEPAGNALAVGILLVGLGRLLGPALIVAGLILTAMTSRRKLLRL